MQTESKQAEKPPYPGETLLDGHMGWGVWISPSTTLLPLFCLHRKRRQDSLWLCSSCPGSLL